MIVNYFHIVASILLLMHISCTDSSNKVDENDPLIASVYEKELRYSELAPLIQTESSKEDSVQYSNALIEKWVRDAILMKEAEENIPKDLDIEKMVDDYRSSLIVMNYKQKLVHEKLDTIITPFQLDDYYDEHKSQYKLEEPIVNCIFIKLHKESQIKEKVDELWKNKKYTEISYMEGSDFELRLMEEETWYPWKDIKALIPNSIWTYSGLKSKEARSKSAGDYKYYIKVIDFADENQISPLSYIEDQAKKVLLHKRQTELLDNLIEDLYVKYSKNNNVKINI